MNSTLGLRLVVLLLVFSSDFFLTRAKEEELAYGSVVARKPPRPERTFLERMYVNGIANAAEFLYSIPPRFFDRIPFPGTIRERVIHFRTGTTGQDPIYEAPVKNQGEVFNEQTIEEEVDDFPVDNIEEDASSNEIVVERQRRFVDFNSEDFQRRAEETFLGPVRAGLEAFDNAPGFFRRIWPFPGTRRPQIPPYIRDGYQGPTFGSNNVIYPYSPEIRPVTADF